MYGLLTRKPLSSHALVESSQALAQAAAHTHHLHGAGA
jgi:hypothetical protein